MTNNFLSHLCLCIKPEYENIKTVNLEEKDKKGLIETGLINNINIILPSSNYNDNRHSMIGIVFKDSKKILRNHFNTNHIYNRMQSSDSYKLINQKCHNKKRQLVNITDENKILSDFIEKVDFIIDDCLKRKSISESSESSDDDKIEK